MVNSELGFDPFRSGCSEIFGRDRQIAAIFPFGVAADLETAAEAKGEVASRIEPRERRKVADHIVERDFAAAGGKVERVRVKR